MHSNKLFFILNSPHVQRAITFNGVAWSFNAQGNHHSDRHSQKIQTKQSQPFNDINSIGLNNLKSVQSRPQLF
jgi:hypothetical protein